MRWWTVFWIENGLVCILQMRASGLKRHWKRRSATLKFFSQHLSIRSWCGATSFCIPSLACWWDDECMSCKRFHRKMQYSPIYSNIFSSSVLSCRWSPHLCRIVFALVGVMEIFDSDVVQSRFHRGLRFTLGVSAPFTTKQNPGDWGPSAARQASMCRSRIVTFLPAASKPAAKAGTVSLNQPGMSLKSAWPRGAWPKNPWVFGCFWTLEEDSCRVRSPVNE